MQTNVRVQLSFFMLLEYFVWGAWYVTMGTFLLTSMDTNATQVGAAYANLSVAAIVSPFFVGGIADRYFSAQKVLGWLHIIGALVLFYVSTVDDFGLFWWLLLLYTIIYMPTIALTNSISFSQMKETRKEFPKIRVFGTLGWIIAGLYIGNMEWEASYMMFRVAAYASLLLGIFCFFLPNTPPKRKATGWSELLGIDALVLFKNPSFIIFFISSILICIPLAFYYNFANPFFNDLGMANAAGKMTMGQVSEFLFLLVMPFAFRTFGIKRMMLIGMLAWVLRYLLFAWGDASSGIWMLYFGIILHGVCYDFFFVSGQIYMDRKADASYRNAAQGLITLATYGVGMLIGSFVSGGVTENYARSTVEGGGYAWGSIWMVPAVIAILVAFLFFGFFKERRIPKGSR